MTSGARQLAEELCAALRGKEDKMVEALLQRGADPNLVLPEGMAAIHLAAGMEQESGIRRLHLILQHGGDPNVRSMEDLTPLHVAASWGCYTCLRLLLMAGGNAWLEDQDGNTALDLALEQGNKLCVRILQSSLEEMDKEQNIWMPERRAESFLTTITEDLSETGGASQLYNAHPSTSRQIPQSNGTPQHMVSCRSFTLTAAPGSLPGDHQEKNCSLEDQHLALFLTECSWPCSVLSEQCDLHAQLGASSSPSFTPGNVSGPTWDCSAVWGCPRYGPAHHMGGAAPFHCAEAAAVAAHGLSLGLNGALHHAKPCTSKAHPETPSTTESHQAPSSCVITNTSECKAEHLPGIRGSNAALDLSRCSSFLDPDLMVERSGQEGLDVTSPDHAYIFSQAHSTAVSDLEETVAEPVFLSRACGSPEGPSASGEPLGRRTDGGGSSPLSPSSSECYVSAAEEQCCLEARGCRERAACFAQAPGTQASSGNHSLLAQPCHSPHELFETPGTGSFGERTSPARSRGLLDSQDGAALRQAPPRTSAEQLALDLCDNGCTRSFTDPALPRMSPAGSLAKWNRQEQDPQPLPESWEKIQSGAENKLLPGSSDVTDEQVASQQPQGEFGGAIMPSVAWAELAREESDLSAGSPEVEGRKSLHTRDTVLILRALEETHSFPGSQSPEVSMTTGGTDDTIVVSDQMVGDTMVISNAKEEAPTSLEARLRSMMLATRACHSPLLQQDRRPSNTTPQTRSRGVVPAAHHSSAAPPPFEDTLEMPRRPRRRRGPKGSSPASRGAQKGPGGTRSGEPSFTAGAGTAEPGIARANPDGGLQLSPPGPPIPSPVVPPNPGRVFAQCGGQSGSACSLAAGMGEQPASDGEVEERGAAPPGRDPHQSGALCSMAKGLPKPSRVSFSRISGRGQLLAPETSGAPDLINQGVRLSPGGRPVNLSVIKPVEYLYVDEDEGHTLIERHIPCLDDSVAGGASTEDTIIYNWQVYMGPAAGQECGGSTPLQASPQLSCLSDEALARKLRDFGVSAGPMTGLTRKVYLQLLEKLMSDPKAKARKGSAGYSRELSSALEMYQIPDGWDDEMALARQFDQPDKSKRWREGVLKSSFNYLLLDPRVTQNLPFRCQFVSQAECFRTFISAIFYVGKGKRSRPYSHLYEALVCYKGVRGRRGGQACSKVQHILEIWASGEGVISMHCFQNVIPVEAYTREACMLDAIGLKMLTNQKKGDYYGVTANWPMKRRQRLGIYLLHRAMQIFLAEGERQLRPADI